MKKVVVFGANGLTGQEVMKLALKQGWSVTGAVRRPETLASFGDAITVQRISFDNPESVVHAVAGQDAVVSTLGQGGLRSSAKPTTVYSRSIKSILHAMQAQQVHRVIAISSGGVEEDAHAPWYYTILLRRYLINSYLDMMKMETILEEAPASVRWTIVRPTYLLDGPAKPYLVQDRTIDHGAFRIHRVDVADFIVQDLEANEWVGKHPVLSYP